MPKRVFVNYSADFETTVFDGQEFTEVWLAGFVKVGASESSIRIQHSIHEFLTALFELDENINVFFHNLKFDGTFILNYLLKTKGFKYGLTTIDNENVQMKSPYKLNHKEFTTLISDKGVWYSLTLKYKSKLIRFIDSYKILPFSLKAIGEAFQTQHQKLEMEYIGERYSGCNISESERLYFINDLMVLSESLDIMFNRGYNKTTIGSNCFEKFKTYYDDELFNSLFPDLYEIKLDEKIFDSKTVGHYINKSYRGGWVYVNPIYQDKIVYDGVTVDANSLYPSQMHSLSGNFYPIGKPKFFDKEIPSFLNDKDFSEFYYFVRFKTKFKIKENHLPFVQIKGTLKYNGREMLTSSVVVHDGVKFDDYVVLTMTCVDFELFLEHYDVFELKILDGCYFKSAIGLFDEYIDNFYEQKANAIDKVNRTIPKLFLNNLYGQFSKYIDSSFKIGYLKDDVIHYGVQHEEKKKPGFIAIGSAITSYSRNTTIRLAQKNINTFCYADTDSLHCNCGSESLIDVPVDDKKLTFWKVEKRWKRGWFHRTKSYIETEIVNNKEIYEITCAGMGKKSKELLKRALEYDGNVLQDNFYKKLNDEEKNFIEQGKKLEDFKKGLIVSGNLKAKTIIGGIVLKESSFILRN